MIVPQDDSSKFTAFVWSKNTMLEFVENFNKKFSETYIHLFTLHAQFAVVLLNAHTKFCDNLLKLTLVQVFIMTCAFTCRSMNETEILTSVCWL